MSTEPEDFDIDDLPETLRDPYDRYVEARHEYQAFLNQVEYEEGEAHAAFQRREQLAAAASGAVSSLRAAISQHKSSGTFGLFSVTLKRTREVNVSKAVDILQEFGELEDLIEAGVVKIKIDFARAKQVLSEHDYGLFLDEAVTTTRAASIRGPKESDFQ